MLPLEPQRGYHLGQKVGLPWPLSGSADGPEVRAACDSWHGHVATVEPSGKPLYLQTWLQTGQLRPGRCPSPFHRGQHPDNAEGVNTMGVDVAGLAGMPPATDLTVSSPKADTSPASSSRGSSRWLGPRDPPVLQRLRDLPASSSDLVYFGDDSYPLPRNGPWSFCRPRALLPPTTPRIDVLQTASRNLP